MKRLVCVLTLFAAIVSQAAPYLPAQLQLRTTFKLSADAGIGAGSVFNPRFFDGLVYACQINSPAFGRYRSGSSRPIIAIDISTILEHRMIAPFRGANASNYLLGSSGAVPAMSTTFSRYDFDGQNRYDVEVPGGGQTAEGFDWVDDQTIIYTIYSPSGGRKRIALARVEAEPFNVTADTRWNAEGYITTSVSTRIRNVRVGDVYSGYAYYGDSGQNSNPNFYALNLATGAETLLGNAGTLTGTGSFGVWTVLERGGYLYVQTTDNGIQVYRMNSAISLDSLYATYTKETLDAITGNTGQYWGLDVTPDGSKLLLGAGNGLLFELGPLPPLVWRNTVQLNADLSIGASSMFNPRFFDGDLYVNQINTPAFGRYPSGSNVPSLAVDNSMIPVEHRMVAPFRGSQASTYLLGSSSAGSTTFSRYDYDGQNRVDVDVPGGDQTAEGFDWVDDQTIIYTVYNPSGNRKRLALAHVQADPFVVTADTRWNPDGYVTTSVSTRIRNVRVGDVYGGYAYYGDAGQNANPGFYALNLATGAETLLGNAGALTGSGSFGVWTVLERGGYLYVQTTDNGIQIYPMTGPTSLGALHATYTKDDIDLATGYTAQYYGIDVTADRKGLIIGGGVGAAYELIAQGPSVTEPLVLGVTRSGANLILTWPAALSNAVVQSASNLSPGSFADLNPQPVITVSGNLNHATIPIGAGNLFFRLRN
ncbi:MAG TPA: hypothetical protein P5186_26550 [Candidatus Paceibacterota bacterium]|nr:hypothetical protein [Verrucomicrobiota bacterium]HRY51615.1 hypothetical protein [Candidatus Paceibacterota bacterium]